MREAQFCGSDSPSDDGSVDQNVAQRYITPQNGAESGRVAACADS